MLNCHGRGFTLRPAQICPNLPDLSELARYLWRPLMCVDSEALVSTFKGFTPVSPSFHPISFEASRCESLHCLQMAWALEEESVGLLSRLTAVVGLTASGKRLRL